MYYSELYLATSLNIISALLCLDINWCAMLNKNFFLGGGGGGGALLKIFERHNQNFNSS